MSNNRMYLICRGCGAGLLMGKCNGAEYFTFYDDMTKTLNQFYEEHTFCDKNREVNAENQFDIAYEISYDEEIKEI